MKTPYDLKQKDATAKILYKINNYEQFSFQEVYKAFVDLIKIEKNRNKIPLIQLKFADYLYISNSEEMAIHYYLECQKNSKCLNQNQVYLLKNLIIP